MNKKYMLDGMWDLSFTLPDENKKITATAPVPGNIEPILVSLGLIDDYLPADSERATAKFESVDDWTYTTAFDAPSFEEGNTIELVFEGIDTIADIYLNDEYVCECCNMHMKYTVDVTEKLKEKDNQLKIVIRSSELWAREHCHDMFVGANGHVSYYDSRSYLRKARHQWGWDNAPRLLTSGIIRSVYIEEVPACRFDEVYLYTKAIKDDIVELGANWIYKTDKKYIADHKIRLTLFDDESIVYQQDREIFFVQGAFRYSVPRDSVKLWWPVSFGSPHMYTVKLEMLVGDEVVAVHEAPFGIRTLSLDRTTDILSDGGEFVFVINGEKVFIRGTNWKPLDPLASAADAKTKTLRALDEAKNLNCNMIRIWGGGIYEDSVFFEYCDEHGIMVWQDFMLACEIPPTDDEYCELIKAEASQVIKKYRNHPSLAVWCGDNENDESMTWTVYDSNIRPSQSKITRQILRDAVLHNDPYRSYVDSSPYVSDENYVQREKEVTHHKPEEHLYPDSTTFFETLRNCKSYFIGETGPILVNAITANKSIFEREKSRAQRLWDSPVLPTTVGHQNDGYFTTWRNAGKELCLHNFGRDFTFDEWSDYMMAINISCAEIFKDVIEYCRVQRWTKTGVIWWSLVDMWPMLFNYSIMDYEYNKKLPYHWIRQSQQEFALMGVRTKIDGEMALYAANDTLHDVTASYTVTAYDADGNGKNIASGICKQGANSAELIQRIAEGDEASLWIIKWTYNGETQSNHVFTKKTTYDVMRKWVEIIGRECGFINEITELN